LHFGYCAARLHSFCFFVFMASRRFANCAICSLVAEFALMVYGYRINVLRCRWFITLIIRGKSSSRISRLCTGATGVAEIRFEQPVRLLRDYRRFHYRRSRNYFLRITAAFKSACLAIDKTQQIQQVLSSKLKKKIFHFWFELFWGECHK